MIVDLDKRGLVALVKGNNPSYEQMEHPVCKANGMFSGSYGRWDWNYRAFENSTEEELWSFYLYLRG